MLKINDYVIHFQKFGLGIVKDIKDDCYIVDFHKYGIKKIVRESYSYFLRKLDDSIISFIINENNYSKDLYLIKKGKDYFRQRRVDDIIFTSEAIYSSVLGTNSYEVEIVLGDNKINGMKCTCPVVGLCKHCVATLFEIRKIILDLRQNTKSETEQLELDLGLDENINPKVDYDYKSFLDFYNAFNDFKENYLDNVYGYLQALEDADLQHNLLEFMLTIPLLYKKSSSVTKQYCINSNRSIKFKKAYSTIDKKIKENNKYRYYYYKENSDLTYRNFIIQEDYSQLIEEMGGVHYDKLIEFLVYADIPRKHDLVNDFIISYKSNKTNGKALLYLKEILTEEEFDKIINSTDCRGLSEEELTKIFDNEKILDLSDGSENKDIFKYIIDNYNDFIQIDKKKTIQTLVANVYLYHKNLFNKFLECIEDELTPYLKLCIDNHFHLIENEDDIDVVQLNRHFTFNYSVSEENTDLVIEKSLYIGRKNVLSITEKVFDKKFRSFTVSNNKLQKINEMFDKGLDLVYGETYRNFLEKKKKEIIRKRKKQFNEQFKNNIIKLSNHLSPEPIMLEEDQQIEVEFNFVRYLDYYTLSYRVGRQKKYIVKDVFELARNVLNGNFYEYGKGLAFFHNIENFSEKYREPLIYSIDLLNNESKGKEIRLDSYNFAKMILKLKGLKINYMDKEYLVRLDKLDYRVSVDSNYNLNDRYSKGEIVSTFEYGFYLDSKQGTIDILTNTKNETQLVSFVKYYRGSSIEDNIDSFKEIIYSKFNHLIDIDDSIKDKFKMKDILIKAYFDYNNKTVTVKTEIFDDENKIMDSSKIEGSFYIKYNKYMTYLNNLGFVNGELKENNKILNFLAMDFTELKKICRVYLSESISNKKIETFNKHTIIINNNSNVMEAFVENSIYSQDELYEILKALKLKKKFVLLKGDRIVRLDNEEAEEFNESVNALKLDKKNVLQPKNIPIYQAIKAEANLKNIKLDEYVSQMINEISSFKNYDISLPNINATLREYQIDGYKWLSILTKYNLGGILADDMGLGKTIQMITLLKANRINKPSLIICPKTLIFNWKSEFQKFDDEQEVVEIYGLSNIREKIINVIDYNSNTIYITSYDSLRNDVDLYNKEFNFLILDEAQVIKNVYAGKSIAVKNIKACHRFALTGTPIENNIIDLWSIFDFIMPEYFEELSEFKSLYNNDSSFVTKVSKRIAPFILRRTKKDVLHDLPNKYEQIITVSMNDDQRKIYDAYVLEAQSILENGAKSFDIFPYLMKLRQICITPSLFVENYTGESTKLNALNELVNDYIQNGHRILIFSQFVKALDIVKELLENNKINYYYLTGETDAKTRIEYTNEFNANEDVKVFLISLKAGGTGLNLIGADTVIHLDPWWNQAVEDQATDRTYRIGQQRNVEVIKLICEDSIEKRVIELQNMKKDLIGKLISNDESSITKLSLDDLKFILKK